MTTSLSARRGAHVLVGALAGIALAVGAPIAASAHVSVSPGTAPAGATSRLTFGFSHGCADAPTTALVVTIPAGVGTAKPVVDATWRITRVLGGSGTPTEVTFTAATPIESGLAASASLDVLFDSSAAGSTVAFPVTQQCVTGSTAWDQVVEPGVDPETVDLPAPAVEVGAVTAETGHGHSAATPAAEAASAEGADAAPVDAVARGLAIGGLAAGVIGIGTAAFVAVRARRARS